MGVVYIKINHNNRLIYILTHKKIKKNIFNLRDRVTNTTFISNSNNNNYKNRALNHNYFIMQL